MTFSTTFHVIDYCNCLCGALVEDAYQFFLVCPKYNEICTVLCNAALPLCPPTLKTLLFGNQMLSIKDNAVVFGEVHKYIAVLKIFF